MVKVKVYASIITLFISSIIGINLLLSDSGDNQTKVYALNDLDVVTTTSTTEPTTTTTIITTKQVIQTTTQAKLNNILSISGYNKVWNLRVDASYKALNGGNSYAIVDHRLSFNGRKMIIYGHSYDKGGGLFQYFQNYDHNISFYNNHKYINVIYNNIKYTYEIFSVYTAVADDNESEEMEYYNVYNYYNNNEWYKSLLNYKNKSDYNTGVTVSGTDKILIIQTCSVNPNYKGHKYSNLLIMGKLIKEE